MRKLYKKSPKASQATQSNNSVKINFDFTRRLGKIKPMHCVNQPPILGWDNFEMFHYLKEAHIPYSRLHDVGGAFGKMLYVDIPNLFRDFDADENKPENYDFTFTDNLFKAFADNGVKPFFRLGVTIENRANVKKYRVYPPKDFAKWARICEHVVAHYNEGWADGFKYGIEYWEIWNEADDRGDPESSFMWCGTFAEYCRLYDVTAKHLKAKFPKIKVGGFASCGFYGIKGHEHQPFSIPEDWVPNPKGSDSIYFIKCALDFLDYVRDHESPLDFFSFHSYAPMGDLLDQTECIALELKKRKIHPELILDEWLPSPGLYRIFKPEQNSEIAATLIGGQHSALDMLVLYDARCAAHNPYAPLFNPMTIKPEGAYYALQYFGELYRRGHETEVSAVGEADGLHMCAASSGKKDGAVMLVNTGVKPLRLDFGKNAARFRYGSITERDRIGVMLTELPAELPPYAFMLLVFDL